MTDTPEKFRTPPRILIPALVESRDNWKEKAQQRNRELKQAQVRNRDLTSSRESWKRRAQDAEARLLLLQEQLAQAQLLLDQAREGVAFLECPDEKKSTKLS